MNQSQFDDLFPNASNATKQRNAHLLDSRPAAVMEPSPGARALGTREAKKADNGRFRVRVESVRKRLLDEDNLCEKFVVDCCRYAELIPGDAPGETKIEVSQRKCGKGEEEHVNVSISRIG